jgi:hypothetical protein
MEIELMNITNLGGPPLAPMGYASGVKILLTQAEFFDLQTIATYYLRIDAGDSRYAITAIAREIRDYGQEPNTPQLDKLLRMEMQVQELRRARAAAWKAYAAYEAEPARGEHKETLWKSIEAAQGYLQRLRDAIECQTGEHS